MASISQTSSTAPRKNKIIILAAIGLALGLFLGWLGLGLAKGEITIGPPSFHGMVIQSPQPMSNFTLTASNGERMSLHDFRGQILLIYFGYTYCPDLCPATMRELKQAVQALGDDVDKVQVIMVSIDPERDTPEILAEYMAHFDPSFIGLTGTAEEIAVAAVPLGIYYEKREGTVATGYIMDHTASVAVIDQKGHLRLVYPFNTTGEDMAKDLRYLIRH